jgi:predicted metalloprotease with PDZ domain
MGAAIENGAAQPKSFKKPSKVTLMTRNRCAVLALMLLAGVPAFGADLTLRIDARDVARRHLQTHETLAVKPGPLVLAYPKWIPAQHAPAGPLDTIIGMEITANGQRLAWKRNPIEMYEITVTVPKGVDRLDIALESGLPENGGGFSGSPDSTARLAIVRWNQYVLLPKGSDAAQISSQGSVQAPAGWSVACALDSHASEGGGVEFEPVSLAQLIDSPVQMGQYMRRVELPGSAPHPDIHHAISIAGDTAESIQVPADFAAGYGNLVAEAGALFASRHYRHYLWILTLSDHTAHFGEEHHESSDDRLPENILEEADDHSIVAGLLGHEYVHSWNGKYRRPQGLLSPDYQKPMDGSLLWVYEGLTEFWGDVLPVRAGLTKPEYYRDLIAARAGHYEISTGPRWRPLADTAVEAQVLYDSSPAWSSARRGTDFYEASVYMWLDVDSELRAHSGGKATLDDFMHRFYSGADGKPEVKPYVENDLYTTLGAIAPADWHGILHKHLDVPDTNALLDGLKHAGWQLSYSPEKNAAVELSQKLRKNTDRQWSIGLRLDKDAGIVDVIEGRAAALAGAAPGMKVIAVNGKKFSSEGLDAAIVAAQSSHKPIELLVENDDYFHTLSVAYFDGPRYPHLTRVEGTPDTLAEVLKSRR